jgi:hypothetical protein
MDLWLDKDLPGHRPIQRLGHVALGRFLAGFIMNIAGCIWLARRRGIPPRSGVRASVNLLEQLLRLGKLVQQLIGQLAQRIYVVSRKLLARRRCQHPDQGVAQGMRFVH